MNLFPANTRWDIFCTVIDNYGDIGVCWRLARQLANEQQQHVRLWVDDLYSFQKLCKSISPQLAKQQANNVQINLWTNDFINTEDVADIIIEGFACNLPDSYLQKMANTKKPTLWLNLDYLTYEDWSINCHALPSLQPNNLTKYFFFTGLAETGGLIRERQLAEQAIAFQKDLKAQQQFLAQLGVKKQQNAVLMLIFSYANNALSSWLSALEHSAQPYQLLIPQTPLLTNLAEYLQVDQALLTAGYQYQKGSLTIQVIPFVDQIDFDKLLWCCDFNLVRGEDSFVRAQYAGKPMLWHIYPQQENTHLIKLNAFLDYYTQTLSTEEKQIINDWWLAWNKQQNLASVWQNYQEILPKLNKHAEKWAKIQKTATDMTTKLANFYKNWLS